MAKSELDRAREDVNKKTRHLSDEAFAVEVEQITAEVRSLRPIPAGLLSIVYRDSAASSLYEVSLTPTS